MGKEGEDVRNPLWKPHTTKYLWGFSDGSSEADNLSPIPQGDGDPQELPQANS
jgi:hypothetical protein